ncbi:unnamed protein product [Urochloa humidicola]
MASAQPIASLADAGTIPEATAHTVPAASSPNSVETKHSGSRKHSTLPPEAPPSKKPGQQGHASVVIKPEPIPSGASVLLPRIPKREKIEPVLIKGVKKKKDDDKLEPSGAVGPGGAPPVLFPDAYEAGRMDPSTFHTECASRRGVSSGTWYFEIRVTNPVAAAGWLNERVDLAAPVGHDAHGYAFRDVGGGKVNGGSVRRYAGQEEGGGGGYGPGDVLGIYIHLPDGEKYVARPPLLVEFNGEKYLLVDPSIEVPGSEICYFKNGICQGSAFQNIPGGWYYPAATIDRLPDQPNYEVNFNFGPHFEFFPNEFGDHPIPQPMNKAPCKGYKLEDNGPAENGNYPYKVIQSSELSSIASNVTYLMMSPKQYALEHFVPPKRARCMSERRMQYWSTKEGKKILNELILEELETKTAHLKNMFSRMIDTGELNRIMVYPTSGSQGHVSKVSNGSVAQEHHHVPPYFWRYNRNSNGKPIVLNI